MSKRKTTVMAGQGLPDIVAQELGTMALAMQAATEVPQMGYIGWDVAITPEGPLLIEANTIPGFNTAQYRGYAWVTEGWGYQPLFDEGLKGTPLPQDGRYDRVLMKV